MYEGNARIKNGSGWVVVVGGAWRVMVCVCGVGGGALARHTRSYVAQRIRTNAVSSAGRRVRH